MELLSSLNHNQKICELYFWACIHQFIFIQQRMIRKFSSLSKIVRITTSTSFGFAQDWSHIYDGIYRFEDNTLGEDILAIREQALTFAKTKLSPYAQEWEK